MIQYSKKGLRISFSLLFKAKSIMARKIRRYCLKQLVGHSLRSQGRLNACYSAFFFHLDSQGSQPKDGATYSGQVSLPQDNLQEYPEPKYQVILYSAKLII